MTVKKEARCRSVDKLLSTCRRIDETPAWPVIKRLFDG